MVYLRELIRCIVEGWFTKHREMVEREFKCHLATLEIGCGVGRMADRFHPVNYVGIDIDRASLRLATRFNDRHLFMQMDVLHNYFLPASFDQVLTIGLLAHFTAAERTRILQEIARVAKEGAVLIFSEDLRKRDARQWLNTLSEHFHIQHHYPMKSGLMKYLVVRAVNSNSVK